MSQSAPLPLDAWIADGAVGVELTEAEINLALYVGARRQAQNAALGRRHRGGAELADPWRTHIVGALGEIAVAKYTDRYWTGAGALGDLSAPDVGGGVQVRYSSRGDALIVRGGDADDQPFVLVTGNEPRLILRGWILGADGKDPAWFRTLDPRRPPVYGVPPSALRRMPELIAFLDCFERPRRGIACP